MHSRLLELLSIVVLVLLFGIVFARPGVAKSGVSGWVEAAVLLSAGLCIVLFGLYVRRRAREE